MAQHVDDLPTFLGLAPHTQQLTNTELSSAQIDRAFGVLLGSAAGDTLVGSTGEWTAATAMAIPVARAAAEGKDLCARATQSYVVAQWRHSTELVLACAAPLAIAYLDDEPRLTAAADIISRLAGADTAASEACVAWTLTLRHAVLTGEVDPWIGLSEVNDPDAALQWMAFLVSLSTPEAASFTEACSAAGPYNALAGALAGARWGASSVPAQLQRSLRGWPGMTADELNNLTQRMLGLDPRPADQRR